MKALTLTQPWATLVILGEKRIETRSMRFSHRGALGIHAAKLFPDDARALCHEEPFRTALARNGIRDDLDLPLAALLGDVQMHGSYRFQDDNEPTWEEQAEYEEQFGNYEAGRFGFLFTTPRRLAKAIKCRGFQGLWNLPDEIVAQMQRELGHEVTR